MKNELMTKAGDFIVRHTQGIQKHSPELSLGAGIAFGAATVVIACIGTTKLPDILEDAKKSIEDVKTVQENPELASQEYTEADFKRAIALVYGKTALKVVKVYAPAIILGSMSLASLLASHKIMHRRSVALTAAYSTVSKGFAQYRERVVEKLGEEADKEFAYGIKKEKVTETVTDPETGKEKKTKVEQEIVSDGVEGCSPYARFFDDASREWTDDPEYNLMFLRAQQAYFNKRLIARGHVTLNEVYQALDIPETDAGAIVGWRYNKENPSGDNQIDFGIYNVKRRANRDFVNGYEDAVLLDFNVDGPIWNVK